MALRILDLCGGTGAWSKPYMDAGYLVTVVDIDTTKLDVRYYCPSQPIHGILAAPPCTEFTKAGNQHWDNKPPELLQEALAVFDACWDLIRFCCPKWWALENPVGRLPNLRPIGKPKLKFDPCDYGDPYTKRTYVWGNFNIPKKNKVEPLGSFLDLHPNKSMRVRSVTPPGFARAFFEANP